ncbi:MAG: hypothetical protein HRU09_12645 [Oligoflexales bacterium]|nr:hypothetical protein [Oligoflexales bacterium]
MHWCSHKFAKFLLCISLLSLSTAYSTTQGVEDYYLRDHRIFWDKELATWDLILVEKKDSKTQIHVGMAFIDSENKQWVLESNPFSGVTRSSFTDFLKQNRLHNIYALRPQTRFLHALDGYDQEKFLLYFDTNLLGLPYNFSMRYDYIQDDKKHYYCSQLLRDLYNHALGKTQLDIMPLKKMDFKEEFARYLVLSKGFSVPYGLPGVSPADFAAFNFRYLGFINKHATKKPSSLERSNYESWELSERKLFFLRYPSASEDDFEAYLDDKALAAWAS